MRNLHEYPLRPPADPQLRGERPLNARRNSVEKAQKCEDKELYELCQQLTRENRHLRREVGDLKKLVAVREEAPVDFCSEGEDDYRELNYECYKKKAIHLLTSLKFLQSLYVEKCSLDKRERVLDKFMGKIRQGSSNHIEELLSLYGQCLNGREEDAWCVDELERESSEYQNNILRRHIRKMNIIMLESMGSLKNSLHSLKVDIVTNNEKISQEIQYYCQKYMQTDQIKGNIEPNPVKNSKKSKKKKAIDENGIQKASWQQIVDQRSKLKERKLEPNVKEKIHESLVMVESQSTVTRSLANSNPLRPSIPKPQSKCKKQEITIIDELKNSKNIASSITPSHQSKGVFSHFSNSRKSSRKHHIEMPSNRKSQNGSPKKTYSYYR